MTIDTTDGSDWWHGDTPWHGAGGSTPPDCHGEVGAKVEEGVEEISMDESAAHTFSAFSFEISSPLLFLALTVVVALTISLLCIFCCRKVRKPTVYQKVEMVSSAEVEEEELM